MREKKLSRSVKDQRLQWFFNTLQKRSTLRKFWTNGAIEVDPFEQGHLARLGFRVFFLTEGQN